ncbi:hypothetical protein SLEP1_g5558 [Rubroshorea leprosula]|uniref:non-specific serine/threonine protein kinase n=1 Tax=Rubroshorea leprosula TaxID=152421 RepID=A0AAV5I267_9ROSI|nr:hypothetical protein SLEP1_g5558 [Rubroshorea leprosula]
MATQICASGSSILLLLIVLSPLLFSNVFGYGSLGPIAAAFGDNGFFCAVDAGGKQEIICWGKSNQSSTSTLTEFFPPMAALSGGEGFLCGITANTSQAFCWDLLNPGMDLVPTAFKYNSYSQIAAGKTHACAIRGSYFSGSDNFGSVDCWHFHRIFNKNVSSSVVSSTNTLFRDPYTDKAVFKIIVSGDGFSCGVVKDGGVFCWGPKSSNLGVSTMSGDFRILASGRSAVCGISNVSSEAECWGDSNEFGDPPIGTRFVGLAAGANHFCGIREDDHGVECWGNIDASSVPKNSGFMAISSSDFTTCGVREVDLVLNCWGIHGLSPPDYSPPLQLCSPGVCSPSSCPDGKFAFNASILNEPELTSLCAQKDLSICLPCRTSCSPGYFPSTICGANADTTCTACSLCQNSSCLDICGLSPLPETKNQEQQELKRFILIIGSSVSGALLILIACCFIPRVVQTKDEERGFCLKKPVVKAEPDAIPVPTPTTVASFGETQVFRLSELKDATHGFKEFNELGRGSFGFVYKAVLPDGRLVAIKRANAATIIHTNNRDFEAELEILSNARHVNIVNLLGYCAEMGERLLVYEYMPNGALHDHLHGELSPLGWDLRLKIALQAARGLEYLHNEANPPIIHQDVKTEKILLDSEWCARIADFGIVGSANDRDATRDKENDVYSFGTVLLEILSGRKAYDRNSTLPGIVEWAVPLIRKGKANAIIDRNILPLPKNVEPLLKLAELAELSLRENPSERPTMTNLASLLDQIVKTGLIL